MISRHVARVFFLGRSVRGLATYRGSLEDELNAELSPEARTRRNEEGVFAQRGEFARGRGRGGALGGRGRGRGRESAAPAFASGGKRVFVGNLSYNTSWQDLKDAMREAGEVAFAEVLVDAASGRSRGCGVVEFARAEDAENAIATLQEAEIGGRPVFVREDRDRAGGAFAKGGRGGRGGRGRGGSRGGGRFAAPQLDSRW